jgi:uncharacterized protein
VKIIAFVEEAPFSGPIKVGYGSRFTILPIPRGVSRMSTVKALDQKTERALRDFLGRVPVGLRYERAILYGSRARGDYRTDSDADLALIMSEHADDWQTLSALSGLAFDVFLDTGILIQPVPISSENWANPDRFPRPGFLRNVAREGIDL